jgi:hypothetical protein
MSYYKEVSEGGNAGIDEFGRILVAVPGHGTG